MFTMYQTRMSSLVNTDMFRKFCLRSIFNSCGYSQFDKNIQLATQFQNRRLCSMKPAAENCKIQVYHGVLTSQVKAVKIISFSTSIGGLAMQPIIYAQLPNLEGIGMSAIIAVYGVAGFFTFITPFLIHTITKKYVTDIELNSNSGEYTATVLTFFLRKKRITFTPEDVKVPNMPGFFTSFHIKGLPMFVEPQFFHDPVHYSRMMGFETPLDFKLKSFAPSNKKEEKKDAVK